MTVEQVNALIEQARRRMDEPQAAAQGANVDGANVQFAPQQPAAAAWLQMPPIPPMDFFQNIFGGGNGGG